MARQQEKIISMETKDNINEKVNDSVKVLNHDRSYVRSLLLGWKTGLDHIGMVSRYLWPSILLTVILPIVGVLFLAGQTDALLRRWVQLGYVPDVKWNALKGDAWRRTLRNILNLIIVCLLIVLSIVCILLPSLTGISYWYAVVGLLVLWIVATPLEYCMMKVSYADTPLLGCMSGYAVGLRNFGSLFSFNLLNFIVVFLVSVVASLPLLVMLLVNTQAIQARAMGDLANLPTLFYVLFPLAFLLMVYIVALMYSVVSFSRCLMWGSIEEVPADSEVEGTGVDGVVGRPESMA